MNQESFIDQGAFILSWDEEKTFSESNPLKNIPKEYVINQIIQIDEYPGSLAEYNEIIKHSGLKAFPLINKGMPTRIEIFETYQLTDCDKMKAFSEGCYRNERVADLVNNCFDSIGHLSDYYYVVGQHPYRLRDFAISESLFNIVNDSCDAFVNIRVMQYDEYSIKYVTPVKIKKMSLFERILKI